MNSQEISGQPSLLSIEKSAALLGMSQSWVRQQKLIPYIRVGRRKLFRPEDLRTFIERNLRGQTPSKGVR